MCVCACAGNGGGWLGILECVLVCRCFRVCGGAFDEVCVYECCSAVFVVNEDPSILLMCVCTVAEQSVFMYLSVCLYRER